MVNHYYFTFRSVTAAMRASRSLERSGIPTQMARTPRELQHLGCGYSLRLKDTDWRQAREIFLREGAAYSRIYRKAGDGPWQEVEV